MVRPMVLVEVNALSTEKSDFTDNKSRVHIACEDIEAKMEWYDQF